MFLFNKKKKDEEEDELEDRGKQSFNKPRPRKKKEPPKPWGKRERYLVLFFLLATVGASAFLSLSARSWKLPNMPRLAVPKFTIPFFSEQTIIIEGRKVDQEKADRVVAEFREQTNRLSGVYGLYVVHLGNGFSYGVYEDDEFQAASLVKLPVMAGMYSEAEEGNLDLDEVYVLKNSDKIAGAGSLYARPAGYEITYRNLIRLMGQQSDNTAFNIARNHLGEDKIREVMTAIGMAQTNLDENTTTPRDIGIFYDALWNGNVISDEHKDELLEYLTDTLYEDWLAEGVSVRFAHKYGRELHVVNDAGIVYANDPFVVVILSEGVVESEADETFPDLARSIYNLETSE